MQNRSGGDFLQVVRHDRFHGGILHPAGAMAGIEAAVERLQLLRDRTQLLPVLQFVQVETAHQYMGTKMRCDIHNALMGTAADQDLFLPFPYLQILFMAEVVRFKPVLFPPVQTVGLAYPSKVVAISEKNPWSNGHIPFCINQAGVRLQ